MAEALTVAPVGLPRLRVLGCRPLALLFATAFILEALLAKSHAVEAGLSTATHIVVTAVLSGALLIMGWRRPAVQVPWSVRMLLAMLCAWAFASAATSQNLLAFNLLFAAVWTAHYGAIWWGLPSMFGAASFEDRSRFILLVFVIANVLSLAFFEFTTQGRGVGFFASATALGRISALATVFAFCQWLGASRPSKLWAVVAVCSAGLLLSSRTRASIGAAVVGCTVVAATYFGSQMRTHRAKVSVVVSLSLLLIALVVVLLDWGVLRSEDYVQFFRFTGGVAGVLGARRRIWEAGLARVDESGLFGAGFDEKFGGPVATRWGIEYPTYDWRVQADPHNMFLTTAMQVGLPAAALLLVILIAIAWGSRPLDPASQAATLGVLAAGLIMGVLDGNWFISFSPADRVSMAILALMLSCPPRESGRGSGGRRHEQAVLGPHPHP